MKTAIFINTFTKMTNYDLKLLSTYGFRNIAIVAQDEHEKFLNTYGDFFTEIHSTNSNSSNPFEKIDYSFANNIVSNEFITNSDLRIISLSEDNLLLAAQLRNDFEIPGMKFEQAKSFRDKTVMKDILRKNNIRTPNYIKFDVNAAQDTSVYFEYLQNKIKLPFVLKPTNLLGGLGVAIIKSFDEFNIFCQKSLDNSFEYEVEEFITGTLFHCDSIRNSDKTLFSVCCEYTNPNFDFQSGKSVISIPLLENDPIRKRIIEFNENVLNVMQLHQGISHHELFLTANNELVFLEIAARSPGAIVTPMYRKAFNVGLEDCDYIMQMEIPFELSPTYETHYISGIFPLSNGIVTNLIYPELNSNHEIKWVVKEGDPIIASKSLRDKSATIIAWNRNYDSLRKDFNLLKDFQCVSVN